MSAIVISSAAPSTTDIYTLSLHDALPILQDLFDENILRQKVEGALVQKNQLLVKVYNRRAVEVDEIVDRKSTRLNSSHVAISYAVFCLKKKIRDKCSSWIT